MQGGVDRVVCRGVPEGERGRSADGAQRPAHADGEAAGGGGGSHHPLELPHEHDHPQSRACPRRRLHGAPLSAMQLLEDRQVVGLGKLLLLA